MITIEKDAKAEEIAIHGNPEGLREFAKKLWQIAEKAETKGKHKEQFTTKPSSEPMLSNALQGESGKYKLVRSLTVHGRDSQK